MNISLPYFDILLRQLARGDSGFQQTFGRHVHWGYWANPRAATGTYADFAAAAERMSERVSDAGRVASGSRVLDVGCGLGGTVDSVNQRFDDMDVSGLNIDGRQLEVARSNIEARPGNQVAFHEGDACDMPFDDAMYDVVLAVECAFHFPSRRRFLQEAHRVLRPGGRLALCDFMPANWATPLLFAQRAFFQPYVQNLVGPTDITWTRNRYVEEAERVGFKLRSEDDVTKNTLPTYPLLRDIARRGGVHVVTAALGTMGLQGLGRSGLLRYMILSFEKPDDARADKTQSPRSSRGTLAQAGA